MTMQQGLTLSLMALALGCGSDGAPAAPTFGELRVVGGAPLIPADGPQPATFGADGDVTTVAAAGGLLVVGTTTGAFALDHIGSGESALSPLEVWSDDAETATGAVRLAFAHDDGVVVLAAAGAFHTHGARLLRSPDSDALTALDVRAVSHGAPGELWLCAARGLGRLTASELSWYAVPGESAAPAAAQRAGDVLLVAYADRLYELALDGDVVTRVPHATGAIAAMAPGLDGAVYLAAEGGLFERDGAGVYTQYTLSDGAPVAVGALAYYPKDGTFALSPAGLVVARPGGAVAGVMASAAIAGPGIVADGAGNLWSGGSGTLAQLPVGTPIGFAADVAPILQAYCAGCHADGAGGAPRHDFSDLAVVSALGGSIRSRVALGQMPPAGSPQPGGADLDILDLWLSSGQNP
jgi:hypothetical protein